MKNIIISVIISVLFFLSCQRIKTSEISNYEKFVSDTTDTLVRFEIVGGNEGPVITKGSSYTEEVKHGFEGGRVVKINNKYHMITSEMFSDPQDIKMRLGYWTSSDAIKWKRESTLYESSAVQLGKDSRASLWGPMPTWDEERNIWNLFYVSYYSDPTNKNGWRIDYEGQIWQAISQTPGINGIGGPYRDVGIILQRGKESDLWEGLQGTDSFFGYKVGNKWIGIYGSANTEKPTGTDQWRVGLLESASINGPWKRLSSLNPIDFGNNFNENPIVTQLDNGLYIVMMDCGWMGFGYAWSVDGLHWSRLIRIDLTQKFHKWWQAMRTPLCLIKENDGLYTTVFTCRIEENFGAVGMVKFKLHFKRK